MDLFSRNLLIYLLAMPLLWMCSAKTEYTFDSKGIVFQIPEIKEIRIDADTSDWTDRGLEIPVFTNLQGSSADPFSLNAKFKIGWNEQGIHILAKVEDDLIEQCNAQSNIFNYDAIEIFLADKKAGTDRIQIVIAPTYSDSVRVYSHRRSNNQLLIKDSVKFAYKSKIKDDEYIIEILIPLANFNITPELARELAMQINVVDKDSNKKFAASWYYQSNTYANPLAMHRIQLSQTSGQPPKSKINAYILNKDTIVYKIWANRAYANKEIVVVSNNNVLYEGKLKTSDENYVSDSIMLKAPILDSNYRPAALFIGGDLVEVVDAGIVPLVNTCITLHSFEREIRAFEALDRYTPPQKGGVLFIGSSTIRQWSSLQADFNELDIIHRGFGGSTMSDALFYSERIVLPYSPTKIILYEGDNDIASLVLPEQIVAQIDSFVVKVHTQLPRTMIYLLSIKPSPSRKKLWRKMQETNQLMQLYASKLDYVDYIDISSPLLDAQGRMRPDLYMQDQLHLNNTGYDILKNTIKLKILN